MDWRDGGERQELVWECEREAEITRMESKCSQKYKSIMKFEFKV